MTGINDPYFNFDWPAGRVPASTVDGFLGTVAPHMSIKNLLSALGIEEVPLTLNQYQEGTQETATYRGQGDLFGLLYATLGLAGEAGEFADKVKKILRDQDGFMDEWEEYEKNKHTYEAHLGVLKRPMLSEETVLALNKELGDALYYLARCAKELGLTLEEVARTNQKKLAARKEAGTVKGAGDDR